MVDSLFFGAILTGRRGGYTSFVQTGAKTPDTGTAEAIKPDPGSSWEGHSGGLVPVCLSPFPVVRVKLRLLIICQLKSELNYSEKKRQKNARFVDDALKTRSIKSLNTETWLLFNPPTKNFLLRPWLGPLVL